METIQVAVEDIYVPSKLIRALDAGRVETWAGEYIENGKMTPIRVRHDGKRYVLVNGLNRLEAAKALGEETITAYLVRAAQH